MWIEGNYRRIFLDMHIDDWNEEFLSKADPEKLVDLLKGAGAQQIVVKCRPHTGLALYPTKIGRMHKGLKGRDYVGDMIELCHKNHIAVMAYFSQIFDNWAYEVHPEWRMVNCKGMTSREEVVNPHSNSLWQRGRYGIVCPNNEKYREYVKECLTEITENYRFESIFLDMPYFPEVCYCPSCRKKYYDRTGRDIPRTVDWSDPYFREWQAIREEWLGEFAAFSARAVKAVRPEVTIEHNLSMLADPWEYAQSDLVAEACDYAGGDLYGGFFEQTYMCKYYRNISKNLPFVFISSRCDPGLRYHTTTKTEEEFILHAIIALVHDGAFSICDGANPDGTLCEDVYRGPVKNAFAKTRKFEKYVGGNLLTNASIWFPSRSKGKWSENGRAITCGKANTEFMETQLNMGKLLREENLPFDVIQGKKLKDLKSDVLIICDTVTISDDEMQAIEAYIKEGGNLYISGHIGNERLLELLEAEREGTTEHDVTYMSAAKAGKEYFSDFTEKAPMNVQEKMELLSFSGDYKLLATVTLPYTATQGREFASIHSNPPGIYTDKPAAVLKNVGKGQILWVAAPIENSRPYMSRRTVGKMIRSLCGNLAFESNAPVFAEVVMWEKEGARYAAVINEQENSPVVPIYQIKVRIPGIFKQVRCVEEEQEIEVKYENEMTVILIPKIELFTVVEIVE